MRKTIKYCASCGWPEKRIAKFCANCGKPIVQEDKTVSKRRDSLIKNLLKWCGILFGGTSIRARLVQGSSLVILSSVIFGTCTIQTQTSEKAVKRSIGEFESLVSSSRTTFLGSNILYSEAFPILEALDDNLGDGRMDQIKLHLLNISRFREDIIRFAEDVEWQISMRPIAKTDIVKVLFGKDCCLYHCCPDYVAQRDGCISKGSIGIVCGFKQHNHAFKEDHLVVFVKFGHSAQESQYEYCLDEVQQLRRINLVERATLRKITQNIYNTLCQIDKTTTSFEQLVAIARIDILLYRLESDDYELLQNAFVELEDVLKLDKIDKFWLRDRLNQFPDLVPVFFNTALITLEEKEELDRRYEAIRLELSS